MNFLSQYLMDKMKRQDFDLWLKICALILVFSLTACQTNQKACTPEEIVKPKAIYQPKLDYPPQAVENGDEGAVTVIAWVHANNSVSHIQIKQSSGSPLLDRAALQHIQKTQYQAATCHGKPIDSAINQHIVFKK